MDAKLGALTAGALGVSIFVLSKSLRRNWSRKPSHLPTYDPFGALVSRFEILPKPPPPPPHAPPPLTGLTFAIKDNMDVEGIVTGVGVPLWLECHSPATATAPTVAKLVDNGAAVMGRCVMDELAYSVEGENFFYGTPKNPAAPGRIPGGSSSGSAVAVAGGLCDFSLGTDTLGSVRVPSALCGIFGIRPTWGVVSDEGVKPLSPSLDTVGWFSKDAEMLQRIGHVLLSGAKTQPSRPPSKIYVVHDAFALFRGPSELLQACATSIANELVGTSGVRSLKLGPHLLEKLPGLAKWDLDQKNRKEEEKGIDSLLKACQIVQRWDFMNCETGRWCIDDKPELGSGIAARVEAAKRVTKEQFEEVSELRQEVKSVMAKLLEDASVMCIPVAGDLPPKCGLSGVLQSDFRLATLRLTAIASFTGFPQITIPVGKAPGSGYPLALGFIAAPGRDLLLLDLAVVLQKALQADPEAVTKMAENLLQKAKIDARAAEADAAKQQGNEAFKAGDYERAVDFYSKAIEIAGNNSVLYSNRAMAYLKLVDFKSAETDCTQALMLDKKNVKALLRRGTARAFMTMYREALDDFKAVLVLEPGNKQAKAELQKLQLSGMAF
mmetsp:Transcript_5277/g.19323  ORF Transcript_5277/g.19323 Transcript_5277/m.19323 type:complete len:608 (-) Transcript_5277:3459-5282(-)